MRGATRALGALLVATTLGAAAMHAGLRRAEPAANSVVSAPPPRIRLEFTEPVEPELSLIVLVTARGDSIPLRVTGDPRDVHAIVAVPPPLGAGAYRVAWRIVSADGHRIRGDYAFTVGRNAVDGAGAGRRAATRPADSAAIIAAARDIEPAAAAAAPPFAGLLRGLGVTALLAFSGLAALLAWRLPDTGLPPLRAAVLAGVAASSLLAVHFVVWMSYVAPGAALSAGELSAIMRTWSGRLELARLLLTLVGVWFLIRRQLAVAATLGIAALLASSAIGHPAAIAPALAIPAKAVHLLAAAIWIGGVLWIAATDRQHVATPAGVRRVSSLALISVVLVTLAGMGEALLFLPGVGALITTTYGQIVLAKAFGTLVLVGFGAWHRRLIETGDERSSVKLAASVRRELFVLTAVGVLGGVLSYVSPRL
ncbi:MAG TPA: copper resistance protein CopC [Gemmatimonadaceae bacterium]|nr:copper resistance protein CopC [Gemmatimonadaceae bacterium]